MYKLIFIFVTLFCLLNCSDVPEHEKCGSNEYAVEKEFCSNGNVYEKCNGENYNPATQFCSLQEAKIYNKCGDEPFNTTAENCCGSEVYNLSTHGCDNSNTVKMKCGGTGLYNPATQFCSSQETKVYDKCGNLQYNTTTENCCGDEVYNLSTHGCDNSNTVKTKCGGTGLYNPATQFCSSQETKVYDKCGNSQYNTTTEGCKDGIVLIKCGETEFYNSATQFCSSQETKVYDKCGSLPYNTITENCCNDKTYSLSMQDCDGGIVKTKCGTNELYELYNPATQFCSSQETKVYDKCDNLQYNTILEACDGVVKRKCGESELYNFATQYCSVSGTVEDKGEFVDARDNKIYKTIVIGNNTWMTENLNYNANGSKCYGNISSNCDMYGRLYNWATAVTACPSASGWHLPSDEEWQELIDAVGESAGAKLRATSGWNSNGNGTDYHGFSALPGGCGYSDGSFYSVGNLGYWWSATEGRIAFAWFRRMNGNNSVVGMDEVKTALFSVRCVKDL